MKDPVNSRLPFQGALLRHNFRRNDLKGECYRGYQRENRVDSRCVPEALGAEKSRNRNVVCKVDRRRQTRPGQQYNASRDNARMESLRLLGQSIHHTPKASVHLANKNTIKPQTCLSLSR